MDIGRVLADRYEVLRLIAEGGTGSVWAARDRELDAEVAIKTVSMDAHGWRAEVRDRFLREAELLALSPHANLVSVREAGETEDGELYLVLELLTGETLAERMRRAPPLSPDEAIHIALGLARGLVALHAAGIVHRDIKPANVILHQEQGRGLPVVKIIDLGISKLRAAAEDPAVHATLTATGQIMGTPQYMSYEQALGERDVDHRTDIWSLGVVLYEMLAARTPFAAPNVNATLAAIRRGTPTPIDEVAPGTSSEVAQIVGRCLQRAPDDRYASAEEVVRALEEAARGPRPPPRRRLLWAGFAAFVISVAVAAVVVTRPSAPEGAGPDETKPSPASPVAAAPDAVAPLTSASRQPSLASPAASEEPPSARPASSEAAPALSSPRPRVVTKVDDPGF